VTGYVVHESELNGGSAARVVAIDASKGSSLLELHLARYGAGSFGPHTLEGVQEIMYTASGSGTLAVGGESHELEPGTAVYLPAGASRRCRRAATGSSATWSPKRSAAWTRPSSTA
jgi:mannose-6-phosphate isomerase-like protein (cupin superfamily)